MEHHSVLVRLLIVNDIIKLAGIDVNWNETHAMGKNLVLDHRIIYCDPNSLNGNGGDLEYKSERETRKLPKIEELKNLCQQNSSQCICQGWIGSN